MAGSFFYIINIQNRQEDYARCLRFMEILEDGESRGSTNERMDQLRSIAGQISIRGAGARGVLPAKKYFEEPFDDRSGKPPAALGSGAKKLKGEKLQDRILDHAKKNTYHIRVKLSRDMDGNIRDLMELRYLALLLQRMEPLVEAGRISVFILPASGEAFPFRAMDGTLDEETYKTVSSYLRLISKTYMGIIYGVSEQKGVPTVMSLNFKRTSPFVSDFPLTPIERDTYEKLFDRPVPKEDFAEAFALGKGRRFRKANEEQPKTAFRDYLLEASVKALKTAVSCQEEERQAALERMVEEVLFPVNEEEKDGLSLLAIALFCFTFSQVDLHDGEDGEGDRLSSRIQHCLQRAVDLAEGVRQIAQNTLQHSQTGTGVFSFSVGAAGAGKAKFLRMALCDYNERSSMTETFVQGLERERCCAMEGPEADGLSYYEGLIRLRQKLRIKNFFREYGDDAEIEEAWERFRRSDNFAHIGLLLFSAAVYRYKGAFSVSSEPGRVLSAGNWYEKKFGGNGEQGGPGPNEPVIPGTQFWVEIPVQSIPGGEEEQILGLAQLNHVHEGYLDFARYISIESMPCSFDFARKEPVKVHESAGEKLEAVQQWRRLWFQSAVNAGTQNKRSGTIFYWDMDDPANMLTDSYDEAEVFWKGFVSALDVLEKEGFRYLAVTNLSQAKIKIFRELCRTYVLKAFPKSMQIYLSQKVADSGGADKRKSNKMTAIHLVGDTYGQAIQNAYCLSVERGTRSFSNDEMDQVRAMWHKKRDGEEPGFSIEISICPFDAILPYKKGANESLFDRQVETMAEDPIDRLPFGNKIADTHMQLGSKVHIQSFYEMAYLFYRTSIANRIAFEIIRELRKKTSVDLRTDKLLFYGYASYSKALLTSLIEILKFYRSIPEELGGGDEQNGERKCLPDESAGEGLAIATYQHNLQSESRLPKLEKYRNEESSGAEKTQLYFDFPRDPSENKMAAKKFFSSEVKLIQIVPISSTLTTFEKMYLRIRREITGKFTDETLDGLTLFANFTAFWVTDATKDIRAGELSNTEKEYIEELCATDIPQKRCAKTKLPALKKNPYVHYLMLAAAVWETPLRCGKCYPENAVMEVPLVSVDQTSTVPAQQIRARGKRSGAALPAQKNNQRLIKLKDCVWKGHILREKNHFDVYIDTQKFFAEARYDVANWLMDLANESVDTQITPLNIIFSPEHTTNIGFAQYVNNYFFKGNAEIVCLNEDKEFRSNFCCEHMALRQAIRQIFALYTREKKQMRQDLPVKFHFVDDTIISGSTFFKANSFLHSLLPDDIKCFYPTNLIDQCFVLVDRLSMSSKQNYVRDVGRDFHSFVHLDISNSRTQGDSCIGCKHVQNAVHLFKRSATRRHALHWFEEINHNAICAYDDIEAFKRTVEDHAEWKAPGRKVLLSHIAQNVIFNENDAFDLGSIYDSTLEILAKLLGIEEKAAPKKTFRYEELVEEILRNCDPLQAVKDLLNLIARPFFAYDFKCKLQTQTMLVFFAECVLRGSKETEEALRKLESDGKEEVKNKGFLFQADRIPRTVRVYEELEKKFGDEKGKIDFLDGCLFSSLAELQSTYLLRKATFEGVYRLIRDMDKESLDSGENFLKRYAAWIHYLLDSNTNESRSIWLEYLWITGEEYQKQTGEEKTVWRSLYQAVTGKPLGHIAQSNADAADKLFGQFCDEIFLQNVCAINDGMEHAQSRPSGTEGSAKEHWRRFRKMDGFEDRHCSSEKELFKTLTHYARDSETTLTVKKKYEDILGKIEEVAKQKYGFTNVRLALLTQSEHGEQEAAGQTGGIHQLDFVASGKNLPRSASWLRYRIKTNLWKALETENQGKKTDLLKYGYQFCDGGQGDGERTDPYVFVFFDNPEGPVVPSVTTSVGTSVGREAKQLVKVFLYFSAKFADGARPPFFTIRMFLRDILAYRHQIMKIMENDFAGDAFAKYAHTSSERNILAHEKVNSHNTSSDDRTALDILEQQKTTAQYEVLDSAQVTKWLLLRNYTNGQIAKLFNRSFSTTDEESVFYHGDSDTQAPPLYVGRENLSAGGQKGGPDRPLMYFNQLGILSDARFVLLEQALLIQYEDALENAAFICDDKGAYYNAEYMKCILIDSLFSAMKYSSGREKFLPRLDHCLKQMHLYRHRSEREDSEAHAPSVCVVTLSRREIPDCKDRDYLVISNEVDRQSHNLFDIKAYNSRIKAHLDSPTDFFDGHMSLLAIREYIEGIFEKIPGAGRRCEFGYVEEDGGRKVRFESKFPILKKEEK